MAGVQPRRARCPHPSLRDTFSRKREKGTRATGWPMLCRNPETWLSPVATDIAPTSASHISHGWDYAAAGRDFDVIGTTLVAASARRDSARSMRANTSRIVAASGSRVTRKWWR